MKSAYELALERLDHEGIERPGDLDPEVREQIAAARAKAEAALAEIGILHRDKRRGLTDRASLQQLEEEYAIDRRRIEERRDREIARLRGGG